MSMSTISSTLKSGAQLVVNYFESVLTKCEDANDIKELKLILRRNHTHPHRWMLTVHVMRRSEQP